MKVPVPSESDTEAQVVTEGAGKEITANETEFPEGGLRAWSVAIGCSGLLFSTFGYVNAFGFVL